MNETETLYRKVMSREWFAFEPVDIDSLQRYSCWIDEWYQPNMNKSDDWEYIRYDDLLNLLKNDK